MAYLQFVNQRMEQQEVVVHQVDSVKEVVLDRQQVQDPLSTIK